MGRDPPRFPLSLGSRTIKISNFQNEIYRLWKLGGFNNPSEE